MQRNISIDYLRGVIAYLGIIFHAALICLLADPLGRIANPSAISMPVTLLIDTAISTHLFRMGTFFIIAGYFFSCQINTRPLRDYLYNRFNRIVLPLAGVFLLFNLPNMVTMLCNLYKNQPGNILALNDLSYLWFLYYLIIYYLIFVLFKLANQRLNKDITWASMKKLSDYHWPFKLLTTPLSPFLFAALTILLTANSTNFLYHLSYSFVPDMHLLIYYLVFFAFGWGMNSGKISLQQFQPYCFYYLFLGLAGLYAILSLEKVHIITQIQATKTSLSPLSSVLYHFTAWLLVYAALGLFSYCTKPAKIVRYLADSSYWVYLSHFPILVLAVPLIFYKTQSLIAAFIFSSLISTAIILATYHGWRLTKNMKQAVAAESVT